MGFRITLQPGGQAFAAEPGEILLDAALRQGVAWPHGCRDGACGACRGKVLSGPFDPGPPGYTLTPAEQAAGETLLCQSRALGDLSLAAPPTRPAGEPPVKTLPARVERLDRLAPDVMRIELRLPGQEHFEYRPGQYLDILLKNGERRAFSLASRPQPGELLELHVRHVPGGVFTDYVFGAMRPREILRLRGPYGRFGLPEGEGRPAVLVAGGTGFAPLKAIIEQEIANGLPRPLYLYWGGRRAADLYLAELAAGWAAAHPQIRFVPVLADPDEANDGVWGGRRGLVHAAVMADHSDLTGFDVCVSGPPGLVTAARHDFIGQCHLAAEAFHADAFEFSNAVASVPASSVTG